ncbi:DMT family transporter [Biformimicrobium ophioploci]|uniref:DMT family transporter n=1 Tax=Biformimicrobium ophioploci TaxID=3036711 RepID=A0ABQ6LWR3_9GAMM|nr:DMT family transporter [Microbulbifer sp. NKW57]GMG86537.1 DMT family transporter [Microbulbifer sp. NKW57]
MSNTQSWRLGFALAMTTALMWGLLPVAMKGLLQDISPATVTWYRFVGAGIFTIAWYHYRGTLNLRHLFSRPLIALTCIASAGLILNYISYALGLHFSTPGAAQVTIQLAPLLLLLASVIWLGEDFSRQQAMGLVLVVAGLVLFFNQRFGEMLSGSNPRYLMGVGLIVVAAITWATYGFFQKKLLKHVGTQDLLALIYILGTFAFLPMAEPASVVGLSPLAWALLAFLTLNTIVAYGAFAAAMQVWDASRVSASLALVPVITLVTASVVAHYSPDYIEVEPLNLWSWVGAMLVVGGSLVTALSRR